MRPDACTVRKTVKSEAPDSGAESGSDRNGGSLCSQVSGSEKHRSLLAALPSDAQLRGVAS